MRCHDAARDGVVTTGRDGDIAIVLEIVREVHRRHASGAEFAISAGAISQRGREAVQHVGHRGAAPNGHGELYGHSFNACRARNAFHAGSARMAS